MCSPLSRSPRSSSCVHSVVPVAVCYGNGDDAELGSTTTAVSADADAAEIPESLEGSDAAVPADIATTPDPLEGSEEGVPADVTFGEIPDDWYGQATIRSGFLWNTEAQAFTGFVNVPFLGYGGWALEGGLEIVPDESGGPPAAIVGVTYHLGDLRKWGVMIWGAENVGINVGPFVVHNFETGENTLAFAVSVLDISNDEGNVDRQRNR